MNSGSIAVVGACIMNNIVSGGFQGEIFPVNPKYSRVRGFNAVPQVVDH
jgi:acetyltransferase